MENLAQSVPGTLMNVGFDIHVLLDTVATGRANLPTLVIMVHGRLDEAPHGDILATRLGRPAEDFDIAIRDLAHQGALHAGAGHAFILYGGHVGLEGACDDEAWLGWKLHHADALHHAATALQKLRAATTRARAFEDAIRTAWFFPRWSPSWTGWMSVAVELVHFARISAAMAHYDLRCMRKAVALEFHDTWRVVYRYLHRPIDPSLQATM